MPPKAAVSAPEPTASAAFLPRRIASPSLGSHTGTAIHEAGQLRISQQSGTKDANTVTRRFKEKAAGFHRSKRQLPYVLLVLYIPYRYMRFPVLSRANRQASDRLVLPGRPAARSRRPGRAGRASIRLAAGAWQGQGFVRIPLHDSEARLSIVFGFGQCLERSERGSQCPFGDPRARHQRRPREARRPAAAPSHIGGPRRRPVGEAQTAARSRQEEHAGPCGAAGKAYRPGGRPGRGGDQLSPA